LATAALRATLVIAAIVLGFFVLSRAFPTGADGAGPIGESPPPTETGPTGVTAATGPTGATGQEPPDQEPRLEGTLQVLNGTDVAGLAADTAEIIEREGYDVPDDAIADAESQDFQRTVIDYRPQFLADAEHLQETFFPRAELREAARNQEFDISITLGFDWAEGIDQFRQ
jgi:hypothetical protein